MMKEKNKNFNHYVNFVSKQIELYEKKNVEE